jgi:hypothetical protein
LTIFSTPGARSSPWVSLRFFSSKRSSKSRAAVELLVGLGQLLVEGLGLQADLEPLLARQLLR